MNLEEDKDIDLEKIIELNKIEIEWPYLIWAAFIIIQVGSLIQIRYIYKTKNSSSFSILSLCMLLLAQFLTLSFSVKNKITPQILTGSLTVCIYIIFIFMVKKYKFNG